MATILALPKLYAAVTARFIAEGTAAANHFGWRKSAQQLSGARVVWIPGDEGDLGSLLSARSPGRNPRPIATLAELFTVEISTVDASAYETELSQYQAARELFDAWYRAVYLAAHGTVAILRTEWITDALERRYGAAIRAVCTIDAMIPDTELTGAPVDTVADVDLTELDVTEPVTAP